MKQERRKHSRLSVIRNVGEPMELDIVQNGKKIEILGFVINLSAGGVGIITLGDQAKDLVSGTQFILTLTLGDFVCKNVEGKIAHVSVGAKAKAHHNKNEWMVGLSFTKIKAEDARHINKMADDWDICETKMGMKLPDICFRQCTSWDICEKPVKLAENTAKIKA